MIRTFHSKFIVLIALLILIFSIESFAYGIDFNDDIQKITLDYYYYDGFGEDKVVQSINNGSWHILKPDGSLINLKGKYLDYAGIESKNPNFHDDFYRFVMGNADNSTYFVNVDKSGLECIVDGYTYAAPTSVDKYWTLMNVENDGKYKFGLYDKDKKKEVVPVIYESLLCIDDNMIIARNEEGAGIISSAQEEIIPFEYNSIQYINDNFIIALNSDGNYGIININNEVILPFEYNEINNVSESYDYCIIAKNNKFGLIDTKNVEILIPIEYESLNYIDKIYMGNEVIIGQIFGKTGVINVKNKEVVPFIYDDIQLNNNCFEVYKDGLAGLLDNIGNEILPVETIDIMEVKDGFITARVYIKDYNHKYVVYDMKGNEIVPPIYDYVDYYASEKYMIVNNGEIANLVDKSTGKEVLNKSSFSDIRYINDKYFAGGNNSYYSIVNFSGQQLTLPYYSNIYVVNVDNEEFLAAEWQTSKSFNKKIDYFKQTNGPSSWAREEVAKAIENNLVPLEYRSVFTFNIKRYEFCTIIVEFLEEYYDTSREDIIKDNEIYLANSPITDDLSADAAICMHLGIVKGRGNGIFDGESEITREEAAVMLTNLAKYLKQRTDVAEEYLNDKSEISAWANEAVDFVLQNKIMQGVGNDMFSPKSNLTREQTYIIMYRMMINAEFYTLFNKASEAWGWFYVDTMPLKGTLGSNGELIIEFKEYNEVNYEGIETLKDLENYLKTIFSKEKVESLLKTGRYFDVDGKLCTVAMGRGTNNSYGKIVEVNKNSINNTKTEYIVSVEKLDYNYEVEGYEKFTFISEKTGNTWVFNEFPAWW